MERYRLHAEAAVYYLTYAIVEWLPVFVSEASCKIITESLTFCHRQKHLCINAYVIMPTHLHLIAFDADWNAERLARTPTDFRKYTGRQLSDYCAHHGPKCFLATLRAQAIADREHRFWQPSRHPEAVQGERFWQQKLDYLHDNPCRKDWCSARITGVFCPPPGTCRTALRPLTCRYPRLPGEAGAGRPAVGPGGTVGRPCHNLSGRSLRAPALLKRFLVSSPEGDKGQEAVR